MRAFGEQNLTGRGCGTSPGRRRATGPTGQVNEVYPNGDGPQDYPTFTAMYPEWVWRYYLKPGIEHLASLLQTLVRLSDYLAARRPRHRADLRPPRPTGPLRLRLRHGGRHHAQHPGGERLPPDRRDAALLGTRRGRRSRPRGPTALPAAVNARLVRRDGIYVDGSDRRIAEPTPRSWSTSRLWPTGWSPPARSPRWGPTWPASGSRCSPTTAWSCCGPCTPPARRRSGPHPHQHVVPRLGRIIAAGRNVHLGDLGAERRYRRQHVPRLGLLGPGGHPGGPARRVQPEGSGSGRPAHPACSVTAPAGGPVRVSGSCPSPAGAFSVRGTCTRWGGSSR